MISYHSQHRKEEKIFALIYTLIKGKLKENHQQGHKVRLDEIWSKLLANDLH